MTYRVSALMVSVMCLLFLVPAGAVYSQESNPDLQKGIAEYRQQNYEESFDSMRKALVAVPYSSLSEYYLGMTYKYLQDYEQARRHIRLAYYMLPEIREAGLELAELDYYLGIYDEALEILAVAEQDNFRPGQTMYMKGLVLMAVGRNDEAMDAFASAGSLSPELTDVSTYQTGLALLNEDRLDESEGEFRKLESVSSDTDMGAFARSYIERIEEKKKELVPYRYYAGIHFQYDDNVVLRPEDESAATNIADDDDYREVYTAGLEYYPDINGPVNFDFHYAFYLSDHHDLDAYNVQSHSLSVVPSYDMSDKRRVSMAFTYNYSRVDDDAYLSAVSVGPVYTALYRGNHAVQAYVTYTNRDFLNDPGNDDEDRDSDGAALTISWFRYFGSSKKQVPFMSQFNQSSLEQNDGYINLVYSLVSEDTDGRNWDNLTNSANASVLFLIGERAKVNLSAGTGYRDFRNTHTVFDKERMDQTYALTALVYYRFYKNLNAQILYSYTRDDSNIALYDYKRNVYSAGIEYRF